MASGSPGLETIIAWDTQGHAVTSAQNGLLPNSPVDMRGVRLWGQYVKSRTSDGGSPMDGSGYLDWLLATQGVNTHACIGKVNGHGRVLYKQAMRLHPRAQPTRGLAVSEAAKATAETAKAKAMADAAEAKAKAEAAEAKATAEAAKATAMAEAKAMAEATATAETAKAKAMADAAEAKAKAEAAEAKATTEAAKATAVAEAKAMAEAKATAETAKAKAKAEAAEAKAKAEATATAETAKAKAMADAAEAKAKAEAAEAKATAEAAKATAMADAAEAMPEVANARGKRVFRLSMRSTSQPDTANYAAIRLHKNVWQLSGEAGSRIAVFATPLALARRPQSVKPWRTRLFLSGCENSGLDERTGAEVEAIFTDDNIIEFSHI
jgi:chemotaxis protein histidine kinase CheA